MRMMANIMGSDNFNHAVLNFIEENQFVSVNSEQFLAQMDLYCPAEVVPQGTKLSSIIADYETEGYQTKPSTVLVKSEGESLVIIRDDFNYRVSFPIDYTSIAPTPQYHSGWWFLASAISDQVKIEQPYPSVILNPLQIGIYRVNYENSMWEEITRQLISDHSLISNRGQLIEDSVNLAIDRDITIGQHLSLIRYLTNETDTWTWRVARESYNDLTFFLRGIQESPRLHKFYNDLVDKEYMKNRITQLVDFEKTMQVGWIACASGHEECIKDAESYVDDLVEADKALTGSADFQYLIYCTLARYSTNQDALFSNLLLGVIRGESFATIIEAIKGLGCSANEADIRR